MEFANGSVLEIWDASPRYVGKHGDTVVMETNSKEVKSAFNAGASFGNYVDIDDPSNPWFKFMSIDEALDKVVGNQTPVDVMGPEDDARSARKVLNAMARRVLTLTGQEADSDSVDQYRHYVISWLNSNVDGE